MATITDPQVILSVNQQLRPSCDRLESAIRTIRQYVANYATDGIGPLVAGTTQLQQSLVADGSTLADGTKGDGRTQLLGFDVDNAVGQMNALLAFLAANPGVEAAIIKPSVNNQPVF